MKGFLTQKEVADLLGVTRQTLWRWRRDGAGPPASKIGGTVLYDEDDLREWIDAQKDSPGETATG